MEEFTPLTESSKKAIQKYAGQERQLSGYVSGDADKVQEIAELNKKVMQSNWYMIDNGADIQAALKEKREQVEENQPVWYSQKYNAEKPDMHLILDLAGMLPAAGAVFDGINATWYLAEGDYTNAALSGMALIPVVGEFAGAGKAGLKGLKCADDIADAVKALDNTKDVAKAVDDMAGTARCLDDVIESGSKSIKELISESNAAKKWGILDDGTNQGVKHFSDYWESYPERIPSLEQRLGMEEGAFNNSLDGFNNFTLQAERVIDKATSTGNIRSINGKTIYYIDGAVNPKKGVVVIVRNGKIQSMMPSDIKSFNKLK